MDVPTLPRHKVAPGRIYVATGRTLLWTVLDRGVAVCIWDRRVRRGGLAHFILPYTRDLADGSLLYGNAATTKLVAVMLESGCLRQDLVARVVGGGSDGTDPSGARLGLDNVKAALDTLARYGIATVSEAVGGTASRTLRFDVESGLVAIMNGTWRRDEASRTSGTSSDPPAVPQLSLAIS